MQNGNGKTIGQLIAAAGVLVILGFGVVNAAKDTPTRAEMKAADAALELRTTRELSEIKQLVKEVRDLQLRMLFGDGGDTRGEGN